VLVVDDVCTTGATLSAAAAALRGAGAATVQGLVIARTPARQVHR
jgi:predicted amidophosphoribosyltransferase